MSLRLSLAASAAIMFAGCGSEVPSPLERQQMERDRAAARAQEDVPIVLTGDGLAVDGVVVRFSSDREAVEEVLEAVLAIAPVRSENRECGAGPMQFSAYGAGLTANFQNGFFIGWIAGEPDERIATAGGARVGMLAEVIRQEPGFGLLAQSTLDGEFLLGSKIGGFLGEEKVDALYAGVNCFFR